MIISHKHKFIFIHIPKCAGSTITYSLLNNLYFKLPRKEDWKYDKLSTDTAEVFKVTSDHGNSLELDQHSTFKVINEYFVKKKLNINEYFKFSFMRNPWERRVSQYKYAKKMAGITNADWANEIASMSFCEFITKRNDSQLNWVSNKKNNVAVNFLGSGRNLQQEFNKVCSKLRIPKQELRHKNATKHKHYTEYYNEETKQIVADNCAKDIEYFNYKFGE